MVEANKLSKSKDLEVESNKIQFVKRMVEQAANSNYYGTLELKFENGVPVGCKKLQSFKIPG